MEVIVDTLCNNMIGDKEQLRDISSIGLKTVINELPLTTQTLAATVCKTIVGRLSSAISQQEDVGVQLEALDILGKNWQSLSILSYFIQPMHSYGTETTVKFGTIMIIYLFFSGDLLQRFGGLLVQFHPSLLEALSPQLKSPRLAVRKRSIIALGHLVSLK